MSIAPAAESPTIGHPFRIIPTHRSEQWVEHADPFSASTAFVHGEFDVEGDLVEGVRHQLTTSAQTWRTRVVNALGRLSPLRVKQFVQSRSACARDIRFHYDRSNDFYRAFLDARMIYSCAYYRSDKQTLDDAQVAKLEHICRKLHLSAGERFLDIGCGWGALPIHAAASHGVRATGCTLSDRQVEHAAAEVDRRRLEQDVTIHGCDYRDLSGQYDKIASIGMFEHVGKPRLVAYFRRVYSLLAPGGLFLNHGITRPAPAHPDACSLFIAGHIFPDGRIVTLGDAVEAAEQAGFEVLDVENLRRHYALTCRAWVERLRANRDECREAAGDETWRAWQLYLAGSAVAFEEGQLNLHQVLLARRGDAASLPLTRQDMD